MPPPRTLTRAEYHAMRDLGFFRAERVELVRGVVVRMSPIGPGHACAVQRLTEASPDVTVAAGELFS